MNSRRFISINLSAIAVIVFRSAIRRKNDAEQHPFIRALLRGTADVRTTVRRDYIVDLVTGDPRPCTVYFDFIVVANHATLGRPAIDETAARAPPIISFECRVEVLMPSVVAHPKVAFLRRRAYTKKRGDCAAKKADAIPPRPVHSITSSARSRIDGGTVKPSALAVLRLMNISNLVGCTTGKSAGFAPLSILATYTPTCR
jgi:hypothetical protein